MKRNPNFEITTKIGCKVDCLKYCPQETILANYKGNRILTLEAFKTLIKDVPDSHPIIFSGLSEPFGNPDTPAMMLEAHMQGHRIIVFSTLVGLKPPAAELIKDIPFERFTLHLPDPYGISNIPNTPEYCQSLNIILRGVERLWFMNMGYYFRSDRSEERVRDPTAIPYKAGKPFCDHMEYPDYFVLPNGDAYFCCQTRGQTNKVGNLFEETYPDLVKKHAAMKTHLQYDQHSICRQCAIATPAWLYPIKQVFGDRLIDIGKRYFL